MKITNVRINQLVGDSKVKALVTVVFDGVLAVSDLRVVDGTNGLFVSMPSRKSKDGKYRDIVFPCTAEMREAVQRAVIGAYKAMAKSEVSTPEEGRYGTEETMVAEPAAIGPSLVGQPAADALPGGLHLPAGQAPASANRDDEPDTPWEDGSPEERELVAVGGEARLVG